MRRPRFSPDRYLIRLWRKFLNQLNRLWDTTSRDTPKRSSKRLNLDSLEVRLVPTYSTDLVLTLDPGSSAALGETVALDAAFSTSGPGTPSGILTFTATSGSVNYTLGTEAIGSFGSAGSATITDWENDLPTGVWTVAVFYASDGTYASSSGSTTLYVNCSSGGIPLVSTTPNPGPANQPAQPTSCPCAGPVKDSSAVSPVTGSAPGANNPSKFSAANVNEATGNIQLTASNLQSGGFWVGFEQNISWTNGTDYSDGLAGNGVTQAQMPFLTQVNGTDSIALVMNGESADFFDYYSGAYHARFYTQATLTANDDGTYVVKDGFGDTFTFNAFSGTSADLSSMTDPDGNQTTITYTGGLPTQVQQSLTTGSGFDALTVYKDYEYSYISSGVNSGLLSEVTEETSSTGLLDVEAQIVQSEGFAYYTGDDGQPGEEGDLMATVVQDPSGAVTDASYYQYYTSSGSGGGNGDEALVKYEFGTSSTYRVLQSVSVNLDTLAASVSFDPVTLAYDIGSDLNSDSSVSAFADTYLAYNDENQVTTAVDAQAGCSVCSGGLGTYTYCYYTNPSAGLLNENAWQTRTTETLPDGDKNIYYTNSYGQPLLIVFEQTKDPLTGDTTSLEWDTWYRYNGDGEVVLMADPSAVTSFSESYPDLVDYGTDSCLLSPDSGLLTQYIYGTSNTATSSSDGDVYDYLKETDLLNGTSGTPVPQQTILYISHTGGGTTTYLVASTTDYRDADYGGSQTTSFSYSWFDDSQQASIVITIYPAVTTAENGPNTTTTSAVAYDPYGNVVWSKDQAGVLGYTQYDTLTGAAVEEIQDVNTSISGDYSSAYLPSGWSGSGSNRVTTDWVDNQGRTIEEITPNGNAIFTVYLDATHEVRTYTGWIFNSSSDSYSEDSRSTLPPTQVTVDDMADAMMLTFTMSAAPHLTYGVPDGTEAVSGLQSLEIDYANSAGQTVLEDDYFNLSGIAVDQASAADDSYGTSSTMAGSGNFDETQLAYDKEGLQDIVTSPAGTITRTVHDGQGNVVATYVGTKDTPESGYWSPWNNTAYSTNNMVQTEADIYDYGGVGDGDLTEKILYTNAGSASGYTASDPNQEDQYVYDWRDRLVAEKDGSRRSCRKKMMPRIGLLPSTAITTSMK